MNMLGASTSESHLSVYLMKYWLCLEKIEGNSCGVMIVGDESEHCTENFSVAECEGQMLVW